jgi:glycosyltransferase involved in cell wall biosynthesis
MVKKVCFFARVKDLEVLERHEFYAQDIRILKELGFQVELAIRPWELRPADLYFVWWWTWAFFPVLVARAFRRPVLITGVFDYRLFGDRHTIHRAMMRYALSCSDANVFSSEFEWREVARHLPLKRPSYIPLVVDSLIYRQGRKPREDFVLTIARMDTGNSKRKCVPELIQAARLVHKAHPGARFVIAGEKGSDYPELEALTKSLKAESYIEFPGPISAERKIDLMQRCAAYASPSRFEGFGLAILEAMSCGAPVVSSSVGAVQEVVGDAGLFVDGSSPDAIANAIQRYLADESLRIDMGGKARKRAETVFAFSRRKKELGEIIDQLLGRRQPVSKDANVQASLEHR